METRRRRPRWSELRPLVRIQPPRLGSSARRLAGAATIGDLRDLAQRRTPRSVFDYVDGAAEQEISLRRAREAFASVEFRPRVLRDVSLVEAGRTIVGSPSSLPLVLAPTGFTRMMHHAGERAVARAAARAGIPYALSTMGTVSVEDVAAAAPRSQLWFQLYLWKDRAASLDLIQRAAASGYSTLVLTVDTAVAGRRLRDVRNGLTIPPALSVRTLADMSLHPAWWFNLLTTEPLEFASLRDSGGTVADLVDRMFDPSASIADLAWIREQWPGRVVVKGIQDPDDAVAVADLGIDGIVVSNHGGRQLDRSVTPLEVLPEVVAAVAGRTEVLLDTGITDGADIVAAVANGASGCLVGRAYLYGLMAGGEAGVDRALAILRDQVTRTMRLLGVSSLDELTPEHAVIRTARHQPAAHPPPQTP
ncbi:alpha-hydroxy-acid oxidizing protein [Intrasporangium calvum]|uniref:Alpha-hydroxy-acid oxidizing protein n=1 Tax=Intrasporangium calvum TaxID=53358 RepID=A0ABT5GKQ4_9MICO|nr:alpha-hydroxy acid oxidase [Intrasporangium calvum]MDC5698782.1 alpha-hydroxy-acid oxidizing protein [Intrasporangium calvum]